MRAIPLHDVRVLVRRFVCDRAAAPRAWTAAAVVLLAALAAGLASAPAASAATAPQRPAVLAFVSVARTLAAAGGDVRLTVRVRNASTCTFRGQSAAFSTLNRVRTVACGRGRATVVLSVEPNRRAVPAIIHYYVRATAKRRSAGKALTVVQAGARAAATETPPPAPPAATALPSVAVEPLPNGALGGPYTATLAASGGRAPYTWSVSSGSLPPGTSLALEGTISGAPTAAGTFAFTVEVADSALEHATARLSIVVAAPALPVEALSPSLNWSGYALDAGPFSSVTGSFDVPSLAATDRSVNVSEWVGIDGASPSNGDLIQAGVAERYRRFGGSSVYAWWEILPAAETRIGLAVEPGDTVTVVIAQLDPGRWSIRIVDETSGETFSTTQAYAGKALSADWIVEAPTDARNRVTTLGQYTPAVTFSRIGWAGPATSFTPIEMKQDGVSVSTPSPLNAAQSSFSVAYGDTAPA